VLENMKAAKYGIQDFLPVLNFSLMETDSTSILAGDSRTKTIQGSITQEIFDGGKRKLAYDLNRINALYAYQEHEGNLHVFSSQIISQYYQYLMQKELIKIRQDLISRAQTQLSVLEKEVALGMTLETDYLEYLISFIQLEHERDQSIRDLSVIERMFKAALGLDEQANMAIQDNFYVEFEYFYYEQYYSYLWGIIKNISVELKKQDLALEFSKKQLELTRRWFVPSLSVQGGISFSGDSYPLTEPRYSLKLTVNFTNNQLFPLSISNGYGFERDRLYNVNNSGDVTLEPVPTYGNQQRLADISILQNRVQRISTEKEMRESVYDIIISHDNALRYVNTAERTITLLERRLEFSRQEVENGEKKYIDYLEELTALSQAKITLLEYLAQSAAMERNLEILANIPFGELKHVCTQK
jgi:outer membrane protein TolC